MKYQTVIKIVTDAENEGEATDIAGEYLRGNLESGVRMKCYTRSIKSRLLFQASVSLVLLSVFLGIASFRYFKNAALPQISGVRDVSAIQPPLKTSQAPAFKETWKEEEDKKILEYIKK